MSKVLGIKWEYFLDSEVRRAGRTGCEDASSQSQFHVTTFIRGAFVTFRMHQVNQVRYAERMPARIPELVGIWHR